MPAATYRIDPINPDGSFEFYPAPPELTAAIRDSIALHVAARNEADLRAGLAGEANAVRV